MGYGWAMTLWAMILYDPPGVIAHWLVLLPLIHEVDWYARVFGCIIGPKLVLLAGTAVVYQARTSQYCYEYEYVVSSIVCSSRGNISQQLYEAIPATVLIQARPPLEIISLG